MSGAGAALAGPITQMSRPTGYLGDGLHLQTRAGWHMVVWRIKRVPDLMTSLIRDKN